MEALNTRNALDNENTDLQLFLGEMIWASFLQGCLLEHCFLHVWFL